MSSSVLTFIINKCILIIFTHTRISAEYKIAKLFTYLSLLCSSNSSYICLQTPIWSLTQIIIMLFSYRGLSRKDTVSLWDFDIFGCCSRLAVYSPWIVKTTLKLSILWAYASQCDTGKKQCSQTPSVSKSHTVRHYRPSRSCVIGDHSNIKLKIQWFFKCWKSNYSTKKQLLARVFIRLFSMVHNKIYRYPESTFLNLGKKYIIVKCE